MTGPLFFHGEDDDTIRAMSPTPDNGFVDYYELLQISPNAELETIQRVYKMLAARYHPDNPETGDLDKFRLLNSAYETLSDADLRRNYNVMYEQRGAQPNEVF